MRRPELGFAARETTPGQYTFQAVIFVASRNGEEMTKTFNPHDRLLSEQETRELGYDTDRIIEKAKTQRISLPEFHWRHYAISWQDVYGEERSVTTAEPEYQDLPEETFDEFQMKHHWDMLTEENATLLREVYPESHARVTRTTPTIIRLTFPSLFHRP